MTNTEALAPARWVTSSRTAKSGYNTVYELLRKEAPADEVRALFTRLTGVRGVHRVEVRPSGWSEPGSGWFAVFVTGTDRGVRVAAGEVAVSGLQALDKNADHDHAGCIASARAMGVPAAWAHTPETYLSS